MNYEISFKLKNAHKGKCEFIYHCTFLKECESYISICFPSTILQCVIYDLKAEKTILMYDSGTFLVSPDIPFYFVKCTNHSVSLKKICF